jgi:DNA-binding NarL/FixJ family response regulator
MNKPFIRIILVDDHHLARQSWSMLLGYDERFSVICECENGEDAIKQARQMTPDVMLVDINMHPLNGFEVTQQVLQANPSIRIIGISVNNHPSYANRMLAIGAHGFITKGSPYEEVAHAIMEVYNGEKYICNEVKNMMP